MKSSLTIAVAAVAVSLLTTLAVLQLSGNFRATDAPAVGAIAGTSAGASVGTESAAASANALLVLTDQVSALEVSLAQEQQGRLMLQRDLADQQELLAQLRSAVTDSVPGSAALDTDIPQDAVHADVARDGDAIGAPETRADRGTLETVALQAAGVDDNQIQDLLRRQDAFTLAELDIRDQAARDGWLDGEEFNLRLAEELTNRQIAEVDFQAELSLNQWDRYLYNSGRSNRVAIASVLSGSAAADVQIARGDKIISYAGTPVFILRDLQQATRAGQRGETVIVRVLRAGEILDLAIPRGPLGVTLAAQRVDPDA